jgi:hypothetical protein
MVQIGSSSGVTRSSGNRVSRANGSIPNHRHRARTLPTEQSIGSPCCTSLVRGSWTSLCNGRLNLFTTQHHRRSGEDGCLITLDHFEPLDLYGVRGQPAAPPPLSQYLSDLCSSDQLNHSFPAYAVSIEKTKGHSEAPLRPHGKE